jgi:hypothetical protein
MMVVSPTDSRGVWTAPAMTRMPSVTNILLLNFVFNFNPAFELTGKRCNDIMLIDCQSTWFGV